MSVFTVYGLNDCPLILGQLVIILRVVIIKADSESSHLCQGFYSGQASYIPCLNVH